MAHALARTFLRLCTLEALAPSALHDAVDPVWPTLAGRYVYDTRLNPIDDLADDERRPIAVVYTGEDNLDKIAQAGPVFYKGSLDLVIEISAVAKFLAEVEGGAPQAIVDYADTDAMLEAQLDLLEAQVSFALHFAPSGALFRKMAKLPFLDWNSHPIRSGEEGERLAARTLRAKVELKSFCFAAAPTAPPADFDRLPAGLKEIAEQLGASTYLHAIALAVAKASPSMPVRTDLESVGLAIKSSQPPAAGVAADAHVTAEAEGLQD